MPDLERMNPDWKKFHIFVLINYGLKLSHGEFYCFSPKIPPRHL